MSKRIVIVQGHPDPDEKHLCHVLADAYQSGAEAIGMHVDHIEVAQLDFPILRSADDWTNGDTPQWLTEPQKMILGADHIVIVYPLWLGTMPALLKAFFEQILRPSITTARAHDFGQWRKLFKGTSARIVVTMGMPAFFYRWFYRAHSVKSLQRNILAFSGVGPVRTTLFGMVDTIKPDRLKSLLQKMRRLGKLAR